MVMITATTYFSNNIMIRHQVTLARLITLMDHPRAIIPPEAGLFEVRSPSQVILVPDHIIFNINRAFVPRPPLATRHAVYDRDAGRCAYCGKSISYSSTTIDHIQPLSQGGESVWENMVTCCVSCNQRKGNRTPEQARMKLLIRPFVPKVRLRPE